MELKPRVDVLLRLNQGLQGNMGSNEFAQFIDRFSQSELTADQKTALKEQFRAIESQAKQGSPVPPSQAFALAVTRAISELDAPAPPGTVAPGPQAPATATTPNPNAEQMRQMVAKMEEELKAKEAESSDRNRRLDRIADIAMMRDMADRNRDDRGSRGGMPSGGRGAASGQQSQNPPSPGNKNDSHRDDDKKKSDRDRDDRRGGSNQNYNDPNRQNQQNQQSQQKKEEKKGEGGGGSAFNYDDLDKKKAELEKKKDKEDDDDKKTPEMPDPNNMPQQKNIPSWMLGGKQALKPMAASNSFFGNEGMGGGFGGGSMGGEPGVVPVKPMGMSDGGGLPPVGIEYGEGAPQNFNFVRSTAYGAGGGGAAGAEVADVVGDGLMADASDVKKNLKQQRATIIENNNGWEIAQHGNILQKNMGHLVSDACKNPAGAMPICNQKFFKREPAMGWSLLDLTPKPLTGKDLEQTG